jgi:undecaprenyl-phosphate 4-deoxy-4-formamido-L-arabinose transferase
MISVVSPVFNSEKTIKKFILTLVKYLKKTHQKYEIVLINDNSKDNSKKIINKIKKKHIVFVDLKKNIGQHKALFEGLKIAKGSTIITLDSDMQDKPSYIPTLFLKYKKKSKIYMVDLKKNYKNFRNIISLTYWLVLRILILKKISLNPTNYLIFSRQDLDELLKKKINLIPYIDFVMLNKNIELYKGIKLERTDKKTSYNFKKLLILSVNIFVNYNIVARYLNNNQ